MRGGGTLAVSGDHVVVLVVAGAEELARREPVELVELVALRAAVEVVRRRTDGTALGAV